MKKEIKKRLILVILLFGIFTFSHISTSMTTTHNILIDKKVLNKLENNPEVEVVVVLKDTSQINYDRALSTEENYEVYLEKAE